ncbi:hypothetical protein [Vibrio parahaemolyticus]|uniref:hypothetical protein n=1 Tax=Vibrio parahaemolyticus TaxID=670 RepID=UPI00111FC64F|nr:hypothetical protein [Vibrio parahaemolyticus]EGR2696550.1 hypothetical protein [Vibrio parahaemolyticus]TOB50235.1 hypothetical protein CGK05_21805 [Vibrio parahaemolyticus]
MSDKQSTFREILTSYHAYADEPEKQRLMAVQSALEIIKADVAASGERKVFNIEQNMMKLSEYADSIQAALNKY